MDGAIGEAENLMGEVDASTRTLGVIIVSCEGASSSTLGTTKQSISANGCDRTK